MTPLDDGEAELPRRSEHSELGFEEALHLVKIEVTNQDRVEYIEDLTHREMITATLAISLLNWVKANPI